MLVTKRKGTSEYFDVSKLLESIEAADEVKDQNMYNSLRLSLMKIFSLDGTTTTKDIHNSVVDELRKYARTHKDKNAVNVSNQYIMNFVHHEIGKPFEKIKPISIVTKRSGLKEQADLSKFRVKAEEACHGISNVSASEVIIDSQIKWQNGISTEELHTLMLKAAIDKIDEPTPNWTYVAARLLLDSLYHKTGKLYGNKKGRKYPTLSQYIEMALSTGKMHTEFWKVFDLSLLDKHVKPERDKLFTYLGVSTMMSRYSIKADDGTPIELPQHTFMGVAMFLAHKEEEPDLRAIEFYDLISNFYAMTATPTLSNARLKNHQLSSCYVGSNDDSLRGIMDGYAEKAFLSKLGGGVGWDWTQVRAESSQIAGYKGVAKGLRPFLKIDNDIALAVDQLGTRKGAFADYIQDWHMDILAVIKMKDNGGEERHRAQDIFPAFWASDEFMRRELRDEMWSLFDPYDVPFLNEVHGDEFTRLYCEAENNPNIKRVEVRAREIFYAITDSTYRHGMPFVCFKDTANRHNNNDHVGIIRSSNLCTEIFQVTEPERDMYNILLSNGRDEPVVAELSAFEDVYTDEGSKRAKYVSEGDIIDNMVVTNIEEYRSEGRTAICNLASINLPKMTCLDPVEFYAKVNTAIRMLDNVIDCNLYPSEKIEKAAKASRAVGLGVMGEMEDLAIRGIEFGSEDHEKYIEEVYSMFEHASIEASKNLAFERGVYPEWYGSKWDVEKDVKVRNGYINAIAPTSSISILTGTTSAIEPVFKRLWYEESNTGTIPVTAPNLTPENYAIYKSAHSIDQHDIISMNALRGKYIDQGISMNIFVNPNNIPEELGIEYIADLYHFAWGKGLKSVYYLRSEAPDASSDVIDRSLECAGCQ